MKIVFMLLVQLFIIGALFRFVARMFIPRPIRSLFKRLLYKSSAALANDAIKFIENIKEDVNQDDDDLDYDDYPNVIDFKSKVK